MLYLNYIKYSIHIHKTQKMPDYIKTIPFYRKHIKQVKRYNYHYE